MSVVCCGLVIKALRKPPQKHVIACEIKIGQLGTHILDLDYICVVCCCYIFDYMFGLQYFAASFITVTLCQCAVSVLVKFIMS